MLTTPHYELKLVLFKVRVSGYANKLLIEMSWKWVLFMRTRDSNTWTGAQYGVKFVLLCLSFVKWNVRFGQVVGEDIHLHATSLYFSSAFAGETFWAEWQIGWTIAFNKLEGK